MSGKCYPEEFRIEAVKQIVDHGHAVTNIAKRLDTKTYSLYAYRTRSSSRDLQLWKVELTSGTYRRVQKLYKFLPLFAQSNPIKLVAIQNEEQMKSK